MKIFRDKSFESVAASQRYVNFVDGFAVGALTKAPSATADFTDTFGIEITPQLFLQLRMVGAMVLGSALITGRRESTHTRAPSRTIVMSAPSDLKQGRKSLDLPS
ncbi:hypothetical protein CQ018_05880 [Arthrobacter sp. MYb227]|uniref:hypothetical protein n=1 Tax=Arthrobacter sp. MYb227 TaxID=1848601 RepID=UPI000CFA86BC|nr:hypothetical protein [Arthrobacter sp. MYb227]PQZ94868.1 hypothetical protein CQ018_05880 [Arthrobacter sp. MYb227]